MPLVSELAYNDKGLEPWEIPKDAETSQDSQRVLYEGHNPINSRGEQLLPDATIPTTTGITINIPWGFTESSLELSPDISASSEQSETFTLQDIMSVIQGITRYSGAGGSTQKAFIREVRAAYERMKNTSTEHELNGFGEMEFIRLFSSVLVGEAKDVLSAYLDDWDHENEDNENHKAADNAERRIVKWRAYQWERTHGKS